MNRYRAGGPSKVSATTLCQKCLKRGHYTYECSASQQERPYISRPSRSEQLLNPKLAPKLSAPFPPETKPVSKPDINSIDSNAESKSVAKRDSIERRPRSDANESEARRRGRSISSYSSGSVSTISTNRSPPSSRSPPRNAKDRARHRSPSESRSRDRSDYRQRAPVSPRVNDRRDTSQGNRDRSRRQSNDDYSSRRDSPPRRKRSPRLTSRPRSNQRPQYDRRRSRSRSPYRGSRSARPQSDMKPPPRRERSLSPYSQRVAMTKAMNAT